jgi:TRAP-type uncharacterized transport system fused permease subunit
MVEQTEKSQATEAELEEMIAATDTGARSPAGGVGKLMLIVAFCWSVFQLWIASPLPYLEFFSSWLPVLNNTDTRSIHLAFAACHSVSGLDPGGTGYLLHHVPVGVRAGAR